MPIQNPISSGKSGWCLVGEYQSKRGCVEIGANDKCMSNQVFSSKELCLNPTFTPNMQPTNNPVPPPLQDRDISMMPLPSILPDRPNELVVPPPKGIY
jgi:hypothetical protein